MKTILLILFLLLALFISSAPAGPIAVIETDQVIVHYAPEARIGAQTVIDRYSTLRRDAEDRLGLPLAGRPTIVLMNDSRAFRDYVGNSLVVAVALSSRNRIVIDYAKVTKRPFSLDAVLKHELCHLILHQNISRGSLPKWLDEGVAQWVSDGIAEVVLSGSRAQFDRAVVARSTIPLRLLNNSFPAEGDYLLLAYEQSKSFVEYLLDEFGTDQLQVLLRMLNDGVEAEAAVKDTFGYSLRTLERNWLADLKRKGVWLTYLSSYMYEFLFVAAALATVLGFLRFLKKRREYNEMEEDDF